MFVTDKWCNAKLKFCYAVMWDGYTTHLMRKFVDWSNRFFRPGTRLRNFSRNFVPRQGLLRISVTPLILDISACRGLQLEKLYKRKKPFLDTLDYKSTNRTCGLWSWFETTKEMFLFRSFQHISIVILKMCNTRRHASSVIM